MVICNKCGADKEACVENFGWRKDTGNWNRICRVCKTNQTIEWESKNKDKVVLWRKTWNEQHNKKYYQENIEKERLRTRNKPKEAVRQYARKQMLKPNRKLRSSVSGGIRFHIKKGGLSHLKFVDWTYEELRSHIESQFETWMNWNNYGRYDLKTWDDKDPSTWTWQIDHIIPHSTFHYESMDCQEFRDCWALKNLRPYSSKQNNLDKDRRIDRAA